VINGAEGDDRIANNINISVPGLDTEFATVVLDKHGFAVSTKSACSGAGGGASAVVLETTTDPARAASTLRITLGPDTTLLQLKSLIAVLKQHIEQMSRY
jgi:cysteine desulfurase